MGTFAGSQKKPTSFPIAFDCLSVCTCSIHCHSLLQKLARLHQQVLSHYVYTPVRKFTLCHHTRIVVEINVGTGEELFKCQAISGIARQ